MEGNADTGASLMAVPVPEAVWRCSGLCRAMQASISGIVSLPAALPLHPDIVTWCCMSGLSDATLAHELHVDGPLEWREYLGNSSLRRHHRVSPAAMSLLQQWWRLDTAPNQTRRWAAHWVTIMYQADYWQIDSLYWRMMIMVDRRYDELSPECVEALVGVRPGPVPQLGA